MGSLNVLLLAYALDLEMPPENDPRLDALERALERQQEISRGATEQLVGLARQEVAIARERRPEVPGATTGWTLDAFMQHYNVVRSLDQRFLDERDRRYAEVNLEREKAVRIKEGADLAALDLAREIQQYKDEKANELRNQIESERGNYVTRADLKSAEEKADRGDESLNGKLDTAIGNWTSEHARLTREFSAFREAQAKQPEVRALERGASQNLGERASSSEFFTRTIAVLGFLISVAVLIVLIANG